MFGLQAGDPAFVVDSSAYILYCLCTWGVVWTRCTLCGGQDSPPVWWASFTPWQRVHFCWKTCIVQYNSIYLVYFDMSWWSFDVIRYTFIHTWNSGYILVWRVPPLPYDMAASHSYCFCFSIELGVGIKVTKSDIVFPFLLWKCPWQQLFDVRGISRGPFRGPLRRKRCLIGVLFFGLQLNTFSGVFLFLNLWIISGNTFFPIGLSTSSSREL